MEFSHFIAQAVAVAYISIAIGMLRGKINLHAMISELEKSHALTILYAFLSLIIGLIVLKYHNLWVQDWRILVTLVGWGGVVKGVMYLAFPDFPFSVKQMLKNNQKWAYVILLIGLVMGYFGFIA